MIRAHPRFQTIALIFLLGGPALTDIDPHQGLRSTARSIHVPVPVVAEVLRAKVRVFADLHPARRASSNI